MSNTKCHCTCREEDKNEQKKCPPSLVSSAEKLSMADQSPIVPQRETKEVRVKPMAPKQNQSGVKAPSAAEPTAECRRFWSGGWDVKVEYSCSKCGHRVPQVHERCVRCGAVFTNVVQTASGFLTAQEAAALNKPRPKWWQFWK